MTDTPVITGTGVLPEKGISVVHSPVPQTLDRPEFLDVKPGDVRRLEYRRGSRF